MIVVRNVSTMSCALQSGEILVIYSDQRIGVATCCPYDEAKIRLMLAGGSNAFSIPLCTVQRVVRRQVRTKSLRTCTHTMASLRFMVGSERAEVDSSVLSSAGADPAKHTTRPIVTGSSVIGMRCKDGVVIACDTLASYGSMARFRQVSRLYQATNNCVIGVGGDYSDFQEIKMMIEKETTREFCYNDGHNLSPRYVVALCISMCLLNFDARLLESTVRCRLRRLYHSCIYIWHKANVLCL